MPLPTLYLPPKFVMTTCCRYAIMCGLPTMMLTVWMQPPDARAEIDVTILLVAVTFKVRMPHHLLPPAPTCSHLLPLSPPTFSHDLAPSLTFAPCQVLMSEQLPPVSYLTFLDWYNLVAVLFIFIGCILHGFVGYLISHHGEHHGFVYGEVEQGPLKALTVPNTTSLLSPLSSLTLPSDIMREGSR